VNGGARIPTSAIATLIVAVSALSLAAVPPRLAPKDLAMGRMLVATPQVAGPVFSHSVVLLIDHAKAAGAIGLIVNRPSSIPLEAIVGNLGDAKVAKSPIHLGGPVAPESVRIAWRSAETPEGSRRVLDNVHTSARTQVLENLIEADTPADEIRAYVGYAGWSPGQLENEIERGDWIVMRGDPALVFHAEPEKLWPRLIGAHGGLQAKRQSGHSDPPSSPGRSRREAVHARAR
jgi:putative transcriptional regulator